MFFQVLSDKTNIVNEDWSEQRIVARASSLTRSGNRLAVACMLSTIASVWATSLVTYFGGGNILEIVSLAYAAASTCAVGLLMSRQREVRPRLAQRERLPEPPPEQLA